MPEGIDQLRARLGACSLWDAQRLGRRLDRLAREGRPGGIEAVGRLVARAERRAAARLARLPEGRLDGSLPIAARAGEIEEAIRSHRVVIVCGETGSGKSTQLPSICLRAGRGRRGLIGHTQPRRIAARTIAARVASELGVGLGREVGFKVRFDDATHPDTFVKVMTDGVLLAEMQGDRWLRRYDTVVIDEAHERSLNVDFLIGCLRRILARRPEFRVVITSATIDPARFAAHFGGAPVIEVTGRTYPVEVVHRSPEASGEDADPGAAVVEAAGELARRGPGDILVFLPGEREIREASEAFGACADPALAGVEVVPLYARLGPAEQMRAFEVHDRRRVVLATNIAETSVTVPGVRYVVDTGLARVSRYHARSRVQGLEIEPISRSSADQRAGRCGRVAEGVCIRLYSEEDYLGRPAYTDPEIVRSNLAGVVLRMKAMGLGEPRSFPFLDAPSPRRVRDAMETLRELGAIDGSGGLTETGRELATMPIDPRLGRMVLAGAAEGALSEVLTVVAALATRDPRERPMEAREEADRAHERFLDEGSDFLTLLKIWGEVSEARGSLGERRFRKWCSRAFLSWKAVREWEDLRRQLERIVEGRGLGLSGRAAPADALHRAVLAGLLSNVGVRGERHEYAGTLGTAFYLHPGSVCFGRNPRWVVAAEIARTGRVYARMVAPIRPEWLVELGAHLLDRTHGPPVWDQRAGAATVVERVSLLGLALPAKRRVPYGQINPVHAREMFIRHGLVEGGVRPDAAFVEHNDGVIREVRRLEAKARRTDHEAEAGARFDFYDSRVPSHVWSAKRFERWRHRAEARNPGVLCMRASDLVVWAETPPPPEAFPDSVEIAGRSREVHYRHEPGAEEDGVAIALPLGAFQGLTEGRHDWLVPGLVRERALEMVRGLAKPVRRGIGPAPEAVDAFLASEPDRERALAETLAEFLGRMRGVRVTPADLRGVPAPVHLVPRLVVLDEGGAPLAEGRDLAEVRRLVAGEVRGVLRAGRSGVEPRDGLRGWDFAEVPESTRVATGGGEVTGYPALVDRGASVSLEVLPEREGARAAHVAGVRRLLALHHRRLLRRTLGDFPGLGAMRMTYAALGLETPLEDEIGLLAIGRASAGEDLSGVRSREAFERLADRVGEGLDGALLASVESVGVVLGAAREVLSLLDQGCPPAWRDAHEETREHVRLLLDERCFSGNPPERLAHMARYVRASRVRLEKLAAGGLERDGRRARELEPRWSRWVEVRHLAEEVSPGAPAREAMEAYRWMLEEYRVSVFAQELGTASRVSAQRLDECWRGVREALRQDAGLAGRYAAITAV